MNGALCSCPQLGAGAAPEPLMATVQSSACTAAGCGGAACPGQRDRRGRATTAEAGLASRELPGLAAGTYWWALTMRGGVIRTGERPLPRSPSLWDTGGASSGAAGVAQAQAAMGKGGTAGGSACRWGTRSSDSFLGETRTTSGLRGHGA